MPSGRSAADGGSQGMMLVDILPPERRFIDLWVSLMRLMVVFCLVSIHPLHIMILYQLFIFDYIMLSQEERIHQLLSYLAISIMMYM